MKSKKVEGKNVKSRLKIPERARGGRSARDNSFLTHLPSILQKVKVKTIKYFQKYYYEGARQGGREQKAGSEKKDHAEDWTSPSLNTFIQYGKILAPKEGYWKTLRKSLNYLKHTAEQYKLNKIYFRS